MSYKGLRSATDILLREAAYRMIAIDPTIKYEDAVERISKHTGFPANTPELRDCTYSAKRLSWDSYYMSLAFLVAMRSPDAQTQHGCVIVDAQNGLVATGYNGWLPGIPDEYTPNLRPKKYAHVIHSEVNAILSAKRDLTGCKVYVTGLPCNECLKVMVKAGITEIVVGDRPHVFAEGHLEMQSLICAQKNIRIRKFVGKLASLDGREITRDSNS
jgi:dCMP deaminase